MEIWRPILGYEGLYEVSNCGNVRRARDHKLMRQSTAENGYMRVGLSKNKKQKMERVHLLVARAFLPKKIPGQEVNHIDENKKNNCVSNLEWCSHSYNCKYGTKMQRAKEKLGHKITQCDLNGNVVKRHESIIQASRETGLTDSRIRRALKSHTHICEGFKWFYTM